MSTGYAQSYLSERLEVSTRSSIAKEDSYNGYKDLQETLRKVGQTPIQVKQATMKGDKLIAIHVEPFDPCITAPMLKKLLPAYEVNQINNDLIEIR